LIPRVGHRDMPERDQWTEVLRCPSCRATGNVVLSQASPTNPAFHDGTDQNVDVELVPDGFKSVVTDLGCQFYCVGCGVLAIHVSGPI
jgi:hypothetical protein